MFWNLFALSFCATSSVLAAVATERDKISRYKRSGNCILPPYPAHGRYVVDGEPRVSPGQGFHDYPVQLNYTCSPGYDIDGQSSRHCFGGDWSSDSFPECVFQCGKITPVKTNLMTPDGVEAERGELPWHAGIYKMTTAQDGYMQLCGGSLVSSTVVISVAHCFWNNAEEKVFPASQYAVALGKLYRAWNDKVDAKYAQKSDVSTIHIPSRFEADVTNFQDDIAILLLTTAIEYKTYIRPVCVDFDIRFDRRQLSIGRVGKIAGWGYSHNGTESGKAASPLKVFDPLYIPIKECKALTPSSFRAYLTSDKICAGHPNRTILYRGDSGGGLAFPESGKDAERYYLRGVASTAPVDHDGKTITAAVGFTRIVNHEHFIKDYILE